MPADVIAQKPARFGTIQTLPALSGEFPTIYSCAKPLFNILRLVRHHVLFISKWETLLDRAALLHVLVLWHLSTNNNVGTGETQNGTLHYIPYHSVDLCNLRHPL